MPDFWRHSGFHLNPRHMSGELLVGDDLLRAYFARPEVAPVAESCAGERRLFAAMQEDPRREVTAAELGAIADADARDNYRVVLRFRDHLLAAGTLERAYRAMFVGSSGAPGDFAALGLPALFADQLAQMIMRNILEDCDDALTVRAAELFFREQRAHVADGQVLVADLETLERLAADEHGGGRFGSIGRLISQTQTPMRTMELDVLDRDNAAAYWGRDERHDMALQINYGRPGLGAFCRAIESWVGHFHHTLVQVEPVRQVESARLHWYTGLDSGSTGIFNAIYNREEIDDTTRCRLLCMMEMRFKEPGAQIDAARGMPCYLALAMDENNEVRMKPQNLLLNLPLRRRP